jgi:undecaprenyl-diphosphatase
MDKSVVLFLNHFAGSSPFLAGLFTFFAIYLGWAVVASLGAFLFSKENGRIKFKKENFRIIILTLLAAGFGRLAVTEPLRRILDFERPGKILNDSLIEFISFSGAPAFPSGHATFFFGLATPIFLWNRKIGAVYYFFALLNSLGRVSAGLHWPSDILAGAAIGIASGIFIWFLGKPR